jgi:hypothetical protein
LEILEVIRNRRLGRWKRQVGKGKEKRRKCTPNLVRELSDFATFKTKTFTGRKSGLDYWI